MARYVDADKFKSQLERASEEMHLIGGVKGVGIGAVIEALDRQPTADVAPKSEVAKEIFEEIENYLAKCIGVIDEGIDDAVRNDKVDIAGLFSNERLLVVTIKRCIAELKKKYTGEQT